MINQHFPTTTIQIKCLRKHLITKEEIFLVNQISKKKTKLLQKNVNNELETLLHADKGESPLVLVKLSNNEWNKMKPNSIHLQNVSIVKPDKKSVLHQKVYYSNYNLGTNITKNQKNITPTLMNMKDEGTSLNASIINVLRIKNSMVAIVTDTDELFQVFNISKYF